MPAGSLIVGLPLYARGSSFDFFGRLRRVAINAILNYLCNCKLHIHSIDADLKREKCSCLE